MGTSEQSTLLENSTSWRTNSLFSWNFEGILGAMRSIYVQNCDPEIFSFHFPADTQKQI